VTGLAAHIGQLWGFIPGDKAPLFIACGVAFIAFLQLFLAKLRGHGGYALPGSGFGGVLLIAFKLFRMALATGFVSCIIKVLGCESWSAD
jgi:hypothetical protein